MTAAEVNSQIAIPYMVETAAFLLTVVVIVPLARRLRISSVLGYLAVGALLGPSALAVVSDPQGVRHLAELGVIFLLFTIGLELSFERLRAFSRLIFGFGAAQVLVTATIIGGLAYLWGNGAESSIIIGLCLALSSTAMVMQLLQERGEIAATHGRASFAVLLFQDLAVVPILILVAAFAAGDSENVWSSVGGALLRAVLAVAAILVIGRYVLRYLFRTVAQTRSVDVFTAMSLLAILATSLVTGYAGLSMALGAFLAGLLLAETEFRHQIESEIEPFKGILLGLFFMSVGMSLNFSMVADKTGWVFASVFGLILLKVAITYPLGRLFGLARHDAARTALFLGEAGEFAFVVVGQATLTFTLMSPAVGQFMVIVAGLSMVLTPLLAALAGWVGRALQQEREDNAVRQSETDQLSGHVLIAGYGRVGQTVAAVLRSQTTPYVALDLDSARVRRHRQLAEPVYFGDAAKPEVLRHAGADRAAAMLVTMDDPIAAGRAVAAVRRCWPELYVLVRARDTRHSDELRLLGANAVVPETLEASLQLAGQLLRVLNVPQDTVITQLENIRQHEFDTVRQAIESQVKVEIAAAQTSGR